MTVKTIEQRPAVDAAPDLEADEYGDRGASAELDHLLMIAAARHRQAVFAAKCERQVPEGLSPESDR